ncbi:Cystathionine beta-synthase [Thermoplasmatales archaeon]|nr:Cystathionine beta-synthase [Thermoplasmatales archaeon]
MKIYNNVLETIGNTPLVKINRINDGDNNILAKLEFFNPGGSIKDRMALYMLDKAEKEGKLKETIVENSSGNTGAALSMISAIRSYRCIVTIPNKMSQEKIDLMKAFGAEVLITKTDVPYNSPESYYSVARNKAKELNAFYPNQYDNPDNTEAHYRMTGPEIWEQTDGEIDVLVAGIGTGGTISGVGRYLKEKNPDVKIIGVDPEGSVFYDYFKTKTIPVPHTYKVEGIGEDYLVKAVDFSVIDDIIQVNDRNSFLMARRLAREEGILGGGSSGSAMWAAMEYSKRVEKKNMVVIFPDSGFRYLSKFYSDDWMMKNGFLEG